MPPAALPNSTLAAPARDSEPIASLRIPTIRSSTRDLTVRGTGLDLSLNSFYDSNTWDREWLLSHGRDVGLEVDHSDGLLFHGPSGYCVNFDENDDGEFESPTGLNADLVENENGTYSLTFERGEYADQIWTFTADGWWISQTDRNGNVNRLRYNSDDKLASIVDSQDRATRSTHDDQGRLTKITDPVGATAAAYTYTDDGQVATLTDRAGQVLKFGYDGSNLTSITDATGNEWTLSDNDAGKVASLSEPTEDGPATTEYSYDGDQTTVTDPNGGESTFTFDNQGRQTSVEDQLGHTRSQEWTANSDVAATTDALNASVTYDYDEFNNLIGTELPTGATTSVGYADSANPNKPTSITDPQGDETGAA
nr:hypothetical protein [Streptomonospora sp. PA3]